MRQTSIDTYHEEEGNLKTIRDRVLSKLDNIPRSCDEIAILLGLKREQVHKRISDLQAKGLCEACGIMSNGKRNVTAWVACNKKPMTEKSFYVNGIYVNCSNGFANIRSKQGWIKITVKDLRRIAKEAKAFDWVLNQQK